MAKSSESTVLHACKHSVAQRSATGEKWALASKSFFPIRVSNWLLRQSERWRMEEIEQGEEKTDG